MKLYLTTLSAAMVLAGAVNAATVTSYDEAIDGDGGNGPLAATSLGKLSNFGDVINVVGGTDADNGDVRDMYKFSSSVDFDISLSAFSVTAARSAWRLYVDDGSFNGRDDSLASNFTGTGFTGPLFGTQSAGSYFFRIAEPDAGVVANYAFNITAVSAGPQLQQDPSPVPLPAGLPLLIGGLGALAFMRRRAKA
ncbi:VPLPA-CTERM sorting domain-containing protein [uncultured Tateyamaria sp.]|uniref:VPLPA-CTERM sorting domain-containing protein n=1 Tax=uncultured Tateyamaria sp. TaxID=455651 RepID=UPI002630CAAA|nr:VPLPA-CTERM sorting domain-containing protein [uncultured Tateyamaria sp.]